MEAPQDKRSKFRRGWDSAIKRVRRHALWWLIGLIAVVGLSTIGLGVGSASATTDTWYDALWLEVAKAGVQVVTVGVLGGALTVAWQTITTERERRLAAEAKAADQRRADEAKAADQRRADEAKAADQRRADEAKAAERRSERNAKIRSELADLIILYNDVKAVRRTLRSLGLDVKLYIKAEQKEGQARDEAEAEAHAQREAVKRAMSLTDEQARGFHEQMRILNTLQLSYESKVRQFAQADLLGEDTATVRMQLQVIESYLNRVLAVWEEHGWTTAAGTRLDLVVDGLNPLYRQAQFKPGIRRPMRVITGLINKHLFGAPPETHDELGESPSAPVAADASKP